MSDRITRIEADPHVPLVRITREFDAAPEKVFRAHTDPSLFAQWVGPHGLTTRIEQFDCRPGGSYRYVSSDAEEDYGFRGCFHDVEAPHTIVQTFSFDGAPGSVALERLTLEPLDGGRTRLVATSLAESFEARDAFVQSGMEQGVNEGYERLDVLLAAG